MVCDSGSLEAENLDTHDGEDGRDGGDRERHHHVT